MTMAMSADAVVAKLQAVTARYWPQNPAKWSYDTRGDRFLVGGRPCIEPTEIEDGFDDVPPFILAMAGTMLRIGQRRIVEAMVAARNDMVGSGQHISGEVMNGWLWVAKERRGLYEGSLQGEDAMAQRYDDRSNFQRDWLAQEAAAMQSKTMGVKRLSHLTEEHLAACDDLESPDTYTKRIALSLAEITKDDRFREASTKSGTAALRDIAALLANITADVTTPKPAPVVEKPRFSTKPIGSRW